MINTPIDGIPGSNHPSPYLDISRTYVPRSSSTWPGKSQTRRKLLLTSRPLPTGTVTQHFGTLIQLTLRNRFNTLSLWIADLVVESYVRSSHTAIIEKAIEVLKVKSVQLI